MDGWKSARDSAMIDAEVKIFTALQPGTLVDLTTEKREKEPAQGVASLSDHSVRN